MSVTWQDEGIPWLVLNLEDVSCNVDVLHDFATAYFQERNKAGRVRLGALISQ